MSNIRHVLFPVDFSEKCAAIRPMVKVMVHKFGAKVTLLHVLQIPASFYPAMETAYVVDLDISQMEDEAKEKLAEFYSVPRHPLPDDLDIVVLTSDPARGIIDFAEARDIDLIMLPTHGYGRYRSFLLGSVAAKVLHDANCPVWTSAHTEDPVLPSHANCRSMLCALDLKYGSKELLLQAVDLAGSFGAKLRIVHAVPGAEADPEPNAMLGVVPDNDFRQFLLQSARDHVATLQQQAGTQLEVCAEGGTVSRVVQIAAQHHAADLVVIGRGKLNSTFGRLRTHAYSIIRDSPCPVISF